MITLTLEKIELYDSEKNEFFYLPTKTVNFEYSLLAMANWESKWKTPFLSYVPNGHDHMMLDFYLMMCEDKTLTYEYLTPSVIVALAKYMKDEQSATTVNSQNENKSKGSGKVYTSEVIYAFMAMNGIDIIHETRNLNRLMTIINVISSYNSPPKKMSQQEILAQNNKLNEERKRAMNTRG